MTEDKLTKEVATLQKDVACPIDLLTEMKLSDYDKKKREQK